MIWGVREKNLNYFFPCGGLSKILKFISCRKSSGNALFWCALLPLVVVEGEMLFRLLLMTDTAFRLHRFQGQHEFEPIGV